MYDLWDLQFGNTSNELSPARPQYDALARKYPRFDDCPPDDCPLLVAYYAALDAIKDEVL